MRINIISIITLLLVMSLQAKAQNAGEANSEACCQTSECSDRNKEKQCTMEKTIYDYTKETSRGQELKLSEYKGKVLLIVNTASKCGFTPQFDGLEQLYKAHKDEGFTILGFPSGDFADQELEDGSKAEEFCKINYGVTFPIMHKVHVNGQDEEPVFTYLKSQKGFAGWNTEHKIYPILHEMLSKANPDYEKEPSIKWNFTKFLVAKDGTVVKRYEPTAEPADIEADIISELKK